MNILYTKPGCVRCEPFKADLKRKGIEFVEVVLDTAEKIAEVKAMGVRSVPYLVEVERPE